MRSAVILAAGVLLLLAVALPSSGSLLPFLDHQGSSVLERLPDPFRVLEHIPFGLDRDDVALAIPSARVDWKETPTAHQIMIDVPGLKSGELKIELDQENRVLRVSGERKKEEEKDDDHWHRVERVYGRFWRQFRLPDNVDLDSVAAKLENGVLTLTFAKLSPEKIKGPRVVSITEGVEGAEKEKEKEKLGAGTGEAKKIEL